MDENKEWELSDDYELEGRDKVICQKIVRYSRLNHGKEFQNHSGLIDDIYDFVCLDFVEEIESLKDQLKREQDCVDYVEAFSDIKISNKIESIKDLMRKINKRARETQRKRDGAR